MSVNEKGLGRLTKPDQWGTLISGNNPINVSQPERLVSLVGGAALTAFGITRQSLFGWLLAAVGGELLYLGASGHSFIYQAFDINTARKGPNDTAPVQASRAIKVKRSITIDKPAAELYQFWRNFENLPRFMEHLASVTVKDDTLSHWVAKAPANAKVEWDAQIINEKENELIAWQSIGGNVANAGSVRFQAAPGNRGTEVIVEIDYEPPFGVVGAVAAKLFGEEPAQQVQEDLRHFKQVMEAGEKPDTKGQPSGRSK